MYASKKLSGPPLEAVHVFFGFLRDEDMFVSEGFVLVLEKQECCFSIPWFNWLLYNAESV